MLRFQFHEPMTLAGVLEVLDRHGGNAAILAGGTALLVDMRQGKLRPDHLVSIWGVKGLGGISRGDPSATRIGAATTITDIANAFARAPAYMCLYEAAILLGSRQIQNTATLAGNICKASPAADMVPPLLCLDAQVELEGPEGRREASVDGFLTGPGRTQRLPAEVLTEIILPAQPARCGTAFLKLMRRRALDLAIVSVCARVVTAEDGETVRECRIAVGAAAPFPFRAAKAEALLTGNALSDDLLRAVAAAARAEARPVSDVRASKEYRNALIEMLVCRAVSAAARRSVTGSEGT